jgi:hypothetical protein
VPRATQKGELLDSDNEMIRDRASTFEVEIVRPSASKYKLQLIRHPLIHYWRGHVRILDHQALEQWACECYGISKLEFDRLLGDTAVAPRTDKTHRLISQIG